MSLCEFRTCSAGNKRSEHSAHRAKAKNCQITPLTVGFLANIFIVTTLIQLYVALLLDDTLDASDYSTRCRMLNGLDMQKPALQSTKPGLVQRLRLLACVRQSATL